MATKKSFVLFTDRKKEIDLLSDAQCGTLFKAILQYAETGERLESEDLVVQVLFSVFASQMDGCNEKWEKIRQARAEAGKKGGAKKGNQNATKQNKQKQTKQANACFAKQTQTKTNKNKQKQTKQAVTVTDTVTGTVTVSVNKNPAEAAPAGASPLANKEPVVPWDAVDFDLV